MINNNKNPNMNLKFHELLYQAKQNFELLKDQSKYIQCSGVNKHHLPNEDELMAFALLGDHERELLIDQLHISWSDLQNRGFCFGDIESASTPLLRYFLHIEPTTKGISDIFKQLQSPINLPEPPKEIWNSARLIRGFWGQIASIQFISKSIKHCLIELSPVFNIRNALLAMNSDMQTHGSIQIPIDNGNIRITVKRANGELYRLLMKVQVVNS